MMRLYFYITLVFISFGCWDIEASKTFTECSELRDMQFCFSDLHGLRDWNVVEVHHVDVNTDNIDELLILRQGNNFAEYHLFYADECGFNTVTNVDGEKTRILYYSSSAACQPIGCLEQAYCEDIDDERFLVIVSGRHKLTLEETWAWQKGDFPEDAVRSEVTRAKYKLVEGKLHEYIYESWGDVRKNMHLFKIESAMDIASCS